MTTEHGRKILYTIGHSTVQAEMFLELLRKFEINCIADVRSTPYCRFAAHFNQDELKRFLHENGIRYVYMGKEFGARREERSLYHPDGYLDFEKTSQCANFRQGVERINNGVNSGYNIALMCTEKNAIDCHRNILVARNFYQNGFEVVNIAHDGVSITQEEIEQQLVDMYFPKRLEINLFATLEEAKPREYAELVEEAYRKRNADIGYRLDGTGVGERE